MLVDHKREDCTKEEKESAGGKWKREEMKKTTEKPHKQEGKDQFDNKENITILNEEVAIKNCI